MVVSFSLRQKLFVVVLIPFVLLLVISSFLVSHYIRQTDNAAYSLEMVKLAALLDNVAHQHALERGLSAGFLDSGGTRFSDRLQAQRGLSDQAEQDLREFVDSHARLRHETALVQPLLEQLKARTTVRRLVDLLSRSSGAFQYYSALNRQALDSIGSVMVLIRDQAVKQDALALGYLLWIKERAGQERGALNGVFASGRSNPSLHSRITGYISEQDRFRDMFSRMASEDWQSRLKVGLESDGLADFYRYRSDYLGQKNRLDVITGPRAPVWFDLASSRIGQIRQVATDLSAAIQAASRAAADSARSELTMWSIALGAGLVISLLAAGLIVRNISRRIQAMRTTLETIAANGRIGVRIEDSGSDELGAIAGAVNDLLQSLDNMLRDVVEASARLTLTAETFGRAIEDNRRSISDQLDQTSMISASVSQMATSIQQVAKTAADVSSSIIEVRENTDEGKQKVFATRDAMEEMRHGIEHAEEQVHVLNNHVQDIEGILNTIRGIAEQTNLLALNAAIEAARAGEQGRGFAVVADEVRALSAMTQESTEEIQKTIDTLRGATSGATASMEKGSARSKVCLQLSQESGKAMDRVVEYVQGTALHSMEIATAAAEQSEVAVEIENNTRQINELARISDAGAERIREESRTLYGIADRLRLQVDRFELGSG